VEVAVSRLNQTLTEQYEAWRERPLLPHYHIISLDGIHFTVRYGDKTDATMILTALLVESCGQPRSAGFPCLRKGATKTGGVVSYKTCATAE
jgi:transposase-like protein